MRKALFELGWTKARFEIKKTINGVERESQSHEIDHVKEFPGSQGSRTIALEIEWNNKDPFFDRDLENFKRLHAEGAISVGVIVTRGQSLQDGLMNLVLAQASTMGLQSIETTRSKGLTLTSRQAREIAARAARQKNPLPMHEAWASSSSTTSSAPQPHIGGS